MGTAIKIGLGIIIGGILLIGACGLLVAAGRISRRTRGSRTPGGDTGGGDTGLEAMGGDTGGSSEPTRSRQRTRRFSGKLYDQTAATTIEVVSVADGGSSSGGGGAEPSVSRDGRYVAFRSGAELVSGATNSYEDIFVRDRSAKTTTRVSVSSAGAQANHSSDSPAISDDGRYVGFSSNASNLITEDPLGNPDSDTNDLADVFSHDLVTRATVRVSAPHSSSEPNGASHRPSLSADGQVVVFESDANDTNGATDVFHSPKERAL